MILQNDDKKNSLAYISYILPFVVWITLMVWIDDGVLSYNIRTLWYYFINYFKTMVLVSIH